MGTLLIAVIAAVVAMVLTAVIAFRRMFRDLDDFVECSRLANQPLWISWWRGEVRKDGLGTERLAIWWSIIWIHGLVALCVVGFAASLIKYSWRHSELPTYKAPENAIPVSSLHR